LTLSGRICLDRGWVIEWTFPDDLNINFSLALNQATLDEYGWVGISFKYIEGEEDGMASADINNFILRELPIDSYADDYGPPSSDEEFGGTADIVTSAWDNLLYVYTWRRLILEIDMIKFMLKEIVISYFGLVGK
jgi:hypothetical protein